MPIIQQLDKHLADLIAAGEVVERPASAAKELVENAIDAGARTITVEIQNGGSTFLRVTDDGCGMEPADARTAFLRHATSKLRTAADLGAIGTLGFRGEALAAIAAVSKIDLLTKTADRPDGISLHLEGGVIQSEAPAGCPDGTTILVRDLFYNTPARMKFLKSDMAEGSAISGAVQRQALAHPEISFRFLKDGKEELHTAGDGDLMGAVYQVLGRQMAADMLQVESKWEKLAVKGYVTKPTATRGNRNYQHFFVNGRYIKSKLLGAALEEAYRNQMMTGRFPACVLHITVPVQAVDVNVHPAKTEIKFLSERSVFDAVHYAVLSSLNRTPGKPQMQLDRKEAPAAPTATAQPKDDFFRTMTAAEFRSAAERGKPQVQVRQPAVQVPTAPTPPPPPPVAKPRTGRPVSIFPDDLEALTMGVVSFPTPTPAQEPAAVEAPTETPVEVPAGLPAQSSPEAPAQEAAPVQEELALPELTYRVIGEALDTYLIVEQGEELIFIDKHAAHERILFENLKAQHRAVMAQTLLMPLTADLSREEAAAVLENADLLSQYGYGLEDFGDGTVLLRQVPADTDPAEAVSGLSELAGKLLSGQRLDPETLRDSLLHTIACKAAIKAGWHTDPAERDALVRQVLSREDIKYCPHGRPVCTILTKKQLEKQFKRA